MNVEFLAQSICRKLLNQFWKVEDLVALRNMSHVKNISDVWTTIEVCIHLKLSRQLLLCMIPDPLCDYIEISDHNASKFWREVLPRKTVSLEIKKYVSNVLLFQTALSDNQAIELFYRKQN